MSEETNTTDRQRARELGICLGRLAPGEQNAITDVAGVRVGHSTIIEGDSVRTGVTVVVPRAGRVRTDPVFAGIHVLNGNGEMTGSHWIEETGLLTSPVAITNTHSVGVVRDALITYDVEHAEGDESLAWYMPVVAETYDGHLNDINGMHVRPEHLYAAMDAAASGAVAEGGVGGGTGMTCHGFKGGIGTASRRLPEDQGGWTVGALVQANYGLREQLRIDGVPVGAEIPAEEVPLVGKRHGLGSIIVVIATDAPLIPSQCKRVAQRATLALGRMGSIGADSSGDIFIAFSTGNRPAPVQTRQAEPIEARLLSSPAMTSLFGATVEAVEEAIVNALCMGETMTGLGGRTAHALPLDRLVEVMRKYGRM